MKKIFTFLLSVFLVTNLYNAVFAAGGINTGNGVVPFGSNTRYQYGILPTNLPSDGNYGASQKAADAYNSWKSTYVTSCSNNTYRVIFDDGSSTVSEGIAYGMLLSVYANDKDLFDGLWAYYQANTNANGVMNWKINGCSGVSGSNGTTDAELDVAMALIIASEQWPSGNYISSARTLIKTIKNVEMSSDGQVLNGDAWGSANSCRNPSYFAPAYYKEFAKVDTDNGTFWGTTAINASNSILSANRNSTSGLVSNWCDNSGTENSCGSTGSGVYGYGTDACRNPWRMAVDYLWHGNDCSLAASDINAKLINFVNGYENQLKGPLSNRNVSNPSSGSYINGSYSTFALPPMTSSSAQSSLNKCYTAVAGLSNVDVFYNSTIRCLTMFVLTGNFWAPGTSSIVYPPTISSAKTDEFGYTITLNMDKTMTSGTSSGSNFTIYYNGVAQSDIISNVVVNSDKTIVISLTTAPKFGQTIELSYNGNGSITCSAGAELEAFTKHVVLNQISSNFIFDDCNDGDEITNTGGYWFTYTDESNQKSACKTGTISSISPLSSVVSSTSYNGSPCYTIMNSLGYDGSGYAVHATYRLGTSYTPFSGGACASWNNPAYLGIGAVVGKDSTTTVDWSESYGISFWYKGPACTFRVIIPEVVDIGAFHNYCIPSCNEWTKITVRWNDLEQPAWAPTFVTFSAQHIQRLVWDFETGISGDEMSSGEIWIDEIQVMGMPIVDVTSIEIQPISDMVLSQSKLHANINSMDIPIASGSLGDTLYLETIHTPDNAAYPVVSWHSSDESIVTVDYRGRVLGVGYGEAIITARSKMQQDMYATYQVKVPTPVTLPTAITFEESTYEVNVGETTTINPAFYPEGVTETGLSWTSSDNTKATVSSWGVVTGVAEGTVTITATSTAEGCSNVKKSVQVTVKADAVAAIEVDNDDVTMEVGGSETVTATIDPQSVSQAVTAVSANTDVATVTVINNEIIISSVGEGTTTITVTSVADENFTKTISVTVNPVAITGIEIYGFDSEIFVGSSTTLTANVFPNNAAPTIEWLSSNEEIATVTNGVVTGVAVGTVTITARSIINPGIFDVYSLEVRVPCTTPNAPIVMDATYCYGDFAENLSTMVSQEGTLVWYEATTEDDLVTITQRQDVLGGPTSMNGSFYTFDNGVQTKSQLGDVATNVIFCFKTIDENLNTLDAFRFISGTEATNEIVRTQAFETKFVMISDATQEEFENVDWSNGTTIIDISKTLYDGQKTVAFKNAQSEGFFEVVSYDEDTDDLNINVWTVKYAEPYVESSASTTAPWPNTTEVGETTYYVSQIVDGCESEKTAISVTVYDLPTIEISGDDEVCSGETATLTASVTGDESGSFEWSNGGTGTTTTITPDETETVTVTSVTEQGCTSQASATVEVRPIPEMPIVETVSYCQNAEAKQLTATADGDLQWYETANGGTASATAPTPNTEEVGETTYYVSQIVNGCESEKAAITVSVKSVPVVPIAEIPDVAVDEEGQVTTIELSDYFAGGESEEIVYTVTSSDPSIVYPVTRGDELEFVQYGSGTVTITVTATAGTTVTSQTFTITVNPKPDQPTKPCELSVLPEITNVTCFGGEDGKIEISVSGGAEPYQYKWNTGRTSKGIYAAAAGEYSVLVRDSLGCTTTSTFTIEEPAEIVVTENITNPTCGNSNGAISITVEGGTAPYTQRWYSGNGNTIESLENLQGDVYEVVIVDKNSCKLRKTYALQESGAPAISLVTVGSSKCDEATGNCEIEISGGVQPYAVVWSDSTVVWNENKRPALLPGTYTVTVSDETNCRSVFNVEVPTVSFRQPEIALVTVGEESGKNLVVWQKPETGVIDHYTIWREGDEYGKYDKLGTIPFSETSIFADPDADIMVQSWRYKISATDACGNESPLSKEHKTIHLQKSRGLDGEVNLVWDCYEGVEYASYLIYRQTKTKVELFKKVSASLNRYTDMTPPTDVIGYFVAVQLHDTIDVNKPLKAESGPFALAISNIAELENYVDAIDEISENLAIVYANEKNIIVNSTEQANVLVFDITGQLVAQQEAQQLTVVQVKTAGVYIVIVGENVYKVSVQ